MEKKNIDLIFKICGNCSEKWKFRTDFLKDKNLKIIGYQAHFKDIEKGLYLFDHNCKTTFGVKVSKFKSLYHRIKYDTIKTGTDECTGKCLIKNNLEPCKAECRLAYLREIMQIIKKHGEE